jgi:ferredoxin
LCSLGNGGPHEDRAAIDIRDDLARRRRRPDRRASGAAYWIRSDAKARLRRSVGHPVVAEPIVARGSVYVATSDDLVLPPRELAKRGVPSQPRSGMTYVITRLCRDCVDGSCVPVCPIPDCIVAHRPPRGAPALPNQLFINPDACIGCGACEPECPWEAIFPEDDVPAAFAADVELNAITAARPGEFVEGKARAAHKPTADEVQANRRRWKLG